MRLTLKEEHLKHFEQTDSTMYEYLRKINFPKREIHSNYFVALVRSIIYQQVSQGAGDAIYNRFIELGCFTPEALIEIDKEKLRNCGLSYRKAEYVKSIAEHVIDGSVDLNNLEAMSNQSIVDMLVQIKGVGVWTAEMFLIFSLARQDVSSYGDLAIKRGFQYLYKLEEFPTVDEYNDKVKVWTPYNTIACIALWHASVDEELKNGI